MQIMLFSDTNPLRIAFAILTVALILRGAYVLSHQRPLFSDEKEYHALALSIVSTGEFRSDTGVVTAYRPVGYPFLLSVLFRIGDSPLLAKCVQAFLDSLTAFLLVLIGEEISQGRGALAGLLWALFPPAILYANMLLAETLSVFLLTVIAFLVFRLRNQSPLLHFASPGVLAGLLVLTKPFLLPFFVFLVAFHQRFDLKRTQVAVFTGCMLVVLLPWAFRNLSTIGEFSLSTNSGLNLYIGNNPSATGAYSAHFPTLTSDSTLNESEVDKHATALALQFLRDHPSRFVVNGFKKIANVFRGEEEIAVMAFHPNPDERESTFREKFRSLPVFVPILTTLPFCLIILLAIPGIMTTNRTRFALFSFLLVGSLVITHAVFFGGSRFHFIFMPFAALLASGPALSLRATLRALPRKNLIVAGILALGLCALWIYEIIYLTQY